INECKETDGSKRHNCSSTSQCENLDGSFRCDCNDGYNQRDSFTCSDIDECRENLHNCSSISQCKNLDGSFRCDCNDRYTQRDNFTCVGMKDIVSKFFNNKKARVYPKHHCYPTDIDECAIDGGHNCQGTISRCHNLPGTFECQCQHGYRTDDNNRCTDIDECKKGTAQCPDHAHCVNTDGGYKCISFATDAKDRATCPSGWIPSVPSLTCIKPFDEGLSWRKARAQCQKQDADLVKIINYEMDWFLRDADAKNILESGISIKSFGSRTERSRVRAPISAGRHSAPERGNLHTFLRQNNLQMST
ncbi:protein kinase C-binding protein NELL1, partial [Elysia marginata]